MRYNYCTDSEGNIKKKDNNSIQEGQRSLKWPKAKARLKVGLEVANEDKEYRLSQHKELPLQRIKARENLVYSANYQSLVLLE